MPSNTFRPATSALKPAINEIPHAAPGLRATPRVRPLDRAEAGVVFRGVAQEADEITHRGMAQSEHQRVAAGIDQLVDPARRQPGMWLCVSDGMRACPAP